MDPAPQSEQRRTQHRTEGRVRPRGKPDHHLFDLGDDRHNGHLAGADHIRDGQQYPAQHGPAARERRDRIRRDPSDGAAPDYLAPAEPRAAVGRDLHVHGDGAGIRRSARDRADRAHARAVDPYLRADRGQ